MLAADLVAVMAKHQATDGAGEKAHCVEGKGGNDAVHGAAGLAEEQLAEDQRGRGAIQEEFVPLGNGARHCGCHHAFDARRRLFCCVRGTH
ncbi:hypothetical protein D3C79_743290 [compost metagenome]